MFLVSGFSCFYSEMLSQQQEVESKLWLNEKFYGLGVGGASVGGAPGGGALQVQSVLSRLLLFLLVPPLLHLRQPLQDLVHSLLVSGLLSQTQSLLVDPKRIMEAS